MLPENKPDFVAGRFSKYIIYALGEVLLIVIGILIALQIKNWNEHHKQRLSINQGLLEVRNNMVNDSFKMSQTIMRMQKEINIQKTY